jgi:membrane associated rhomboid family serine protease
MFNVPGSVLAVIAVLFAVHGALAAMPGEWQAWLTLALAFIPARYTGFADAIPGGDIASVTSFLTYTLVHGDIFHLAINTAWLVAFGGVVANRIGGPRFLIFSAFCAIVGAATFLMLNPGQMVPMVGASGAVSGLMGGTMRFLFSAVGHGGFFALRENPRAIPLMPLGEAISDRRVLLVTGAFLVANILAVLGLGGVHAGGIAWEAHVGGYFAGFLTFGFFEPEPTLRSPDASTVN